MLSVKRRPARRAGLAHASLLALPNLRRVYLDQLPLRDSPNPKRWLVALILADTGELPALVGQVRAHQAQAADGVVWLDLLDNATIAAKTGLAVEEVAGLRQ